MKTFMIRNGDLVVGPEGFETIDGPAKVGQDLRMAVGEPLGNDRFHPGWGSTLDNMIGGLADADSAAAAQQEVTRVVSNYVQVQRAMMQADLTAGVRSRFSTGEVIASVDSIKATPRTDAVAVQVVIKTANATTVAVHADSGGTP